MVRCSARRIGALDLLLVVAVASCAGSGVPSAGALPAPAADARLTGDDLERTGSVDLYNAVQHLRPEWLQVRGGFSAQGRATITVFVDGVRQNGSVEVMKNIRTTDVQEVRYVGARDATTHYGTNLTGGAIEIVTKR
jgi:hypothetical protein